jgi:aminoglycoside phosphotransferase (APT) family kinase protein
MLVGYMGHARYEMLFYTRVRPELKIETPLCYHSASDKRSFAAIHVIEDLAATKQARFGDETLHVSRAQADDLVDLLAELHGTFLGSDRFDDADLNWLVRYHDWFTIGIERVHTDRYCEKATRKAAHLLPAGLQARRAEIWPATMRALEIHRQQPLTVIHSDVHVANWYVTAEGRMGLLDWQCVATGHWARDLSYALSTCLTIANRRAWERELVGRYVDALNRRAGSRVRFEDAWLYYRQQMLHALMMWTQTLCHPVLQPNSQRDALTYALLERIYTAIDDLDSLDAFPEELAA